MSSDICVCSLIYGIVKDFICDFFMAVKTSYFAIFQKLRKKLEAQRSIFIEDFPYMPPTMFRFIWPSGFRGEDSNVES